MSANKVLLFCLLLQFYPAKSGALLIIHKMTLATDVISVNPTTLTNYVYKHEI